MNKTLKNRIKALERAEKAFYDQVKQYNPYFTIKTFEQLCVHNVRFLKGEVKQTYYHLGPTDPETEPLLEDLIKLNEKGFYTTNGQPGLEEDDLRQVAFIEGTVKTKEQAKRLVSFLETEGLDYIYCSPGDVTCNFERDSTDLTLEKNEKGEWEVYSNIKTDGLSDNFKSDMPNIDKIIKHSFVIMERAYGPQKMKLEEKLLNFFV